MEWSFSSLGSTHSHHIDSTPNTERTESALQKTVGSVSEGTSQPYENTGCNERRDPTDRKYRDEQVHHASDEEDGCDEHR